MASYKPKIQFLARVTYDFAHDNVVARTARYESMDGEVREDTISVTIPHEALVRVQHHIGGLIYTRGLGEITQDHFTLQRQRILRRAFVESCHPDKTDLAYEYRDGLPRLLHSTILP